MPRFCPGCGAHIEEDGAAFCPACRRAAGQEMEDRVAAAPAPAVATRLTDNVAGMLAYITVIPAIVFLVLEPYRKKAFVRFHSFQSIFFFAAWLVVSVAVSAIGEIPVVVLLTLIVLPLVLLAGIDTLVVLVLKAYRGEVFKLPVIGDMAEKQASA